MAEHRSVLTIREGTLMLRRFGFSSTTSRPRRRVACWLAAASVVLTVALCIAFRCAVHHEPRFYTAALEPHSPIDATDGDALERNVLQLHNHLRQPGQWTVVFTQEQINGWLAHDLMEKFPDLLPPEVSQPRVALEPGRLLIGFRYRTTGLDAVVTLVAELFLTDQPNELGIRFCRARLGLVPISLDPFLSGVTEALLAAGIRLRWTQEDGVPVAVVSLVPLDARYGLADVQLEALQIRQGELWLAGRTGTGDSQRVASVPGGAGRKLTLQP